MKLFSILFFFMFFFTQGIAQPAWYTQNSGTNRFLTNVFFIDDSTGWITGWTGTILYTSDGGTTWNAQSPPPNNAYEAIHFVDTQTGWAVGYGGSIIHTTDGGTTWNSQISSTQNYIMDVHFLNADTGWTAGGRFANLGIDPIRQILFTANGGITWTSQLYDLNEVPLRSIYFVDKNNGFAVGESNTILHTANGGTSWVEQMSGTGYHYYDVYFVNPDTGWVVGQDLSLDHYAVIFSTTDGGVNWNLQTFNTDESLSGVCFVNDSTGWAVGGSNTVGRVLHTIDRGSTWSSQNSGTPNPLTKVCFVNENSGWAVGYDGTIIHYGSGPVDIGNQNEIDRVHQTFFLEKNYPNPFNPTTTIKFDLPKTSEVTLRIFNISGEEVATLVSDRLSAGAYSYEWSRPAGIASGVYLYRLQAGNYIETRKMVLMK